jgi:hypothetical protein
MNEVAFSIKSEHPVIYVVYPPPEKSWKIIGNSSKGLNPWIKYEGNGIFIQRGVFDINKIDLPSQLEKLELYYVISNKDRDLILENICSGLSVDCEGRPDCIFMLSRDSFSKTCRKIFDNQSKNEQDNFQKKYCNKNMKASDCLCINRILDKQYSTIKKLNPFNDGCWYIPCIDSNQLKLSDINSSACPKNFCQVIYDLNKNKDIVLKQNSNKILCDFESISKDAKEHNTSIFILIVVGLIVVGIIITAVKE